MFQRIVAPFLSWMLIATTGGVLSAQELKQPVANYAGPQLKPLAAAAPTNPGDKEYIPTGNLCALMHAWEKATGHELKLGEPIEVPEWRQMVIAGGSTGWVWVPARTQYWEFNGKALFFGPMPDNKDVPKNRGTGCCNPVGEGFIPNPEPATAPLEPQPAPPAAVQPAKPEPIRTLPPQPTWRADHNTFNVNIDNSIKVEQHVVIKKGHGKAYVIAVAIVGAVAVGVVEATHKKGSTPTTTTTCASCYGGPPSTTPGGPGH
jgi:hypothetical protein